MKKHFGISAELECRKRGWFPRGGGIVTLKTEPIAGTLPPIHVVDPGEVVEIRGLSMVRCTRLLFMVSSVRTYLYTRVFNGCHASAFCSPKPSHTIYGDLEGEMMAFPPKVKREALGKSGSPNDVLL